MFPHAVLHIDGCLKKGSMADACILGSLRLMKYVAARDTQTYWRKVTKIAARNGHVSILQWLSDFHADRCDWGANIRDKVAEYGQLTAVQWLHTHHQDGCTTGALDQAAWNGHLPTAQWLHANRSEGCTTRAMDVAALNGQLQMIKWLHVNRTEGCTTEAMDIAAGRGHLDVVKWLHENRTEGCTSDAMIYAADQGHLDVVQWLHENRTEGCTPEAMDWAAEKGHLHVDVVKWLHVNRAEGCTTDAMTFAAERGHLEVVRWLHENRSVGCSDRAFCSAAKNDHLEMVQWLDANGQKGNLTGVVTTNGHIPIIQWLLSSIENGAQRGSCTRFALTLATMKVKQDSMAGTSRRIDYCTSGMKFWLYSSASLAACVGLLWYTYVTRQQFYPSVIYLVTSKVSVLVLGNAGLVLTTLFGRVLKSFFLGTLRDAEVELLHENVRYAVTETCLALTIFREEISFHVMVLFTALVFLKIFHWLSQARIEFIEQTDVITRLTHVRLVGLMAMLAAVDTGFVVWCSLKVMEIGPSVFILFGFEFLILLVTIIATFLRYVLYVVDSRMDGAWTNKFTYLFYLELVSEVTKLVVYLVFFMLIFTYYGMPLHIVRDLWISIKNLQRRIASYFRYRKITAHLNERFPNPTEEELQETDRTCIICREEMTPDTCKKLPCSHIFHVDCLKMWVQRQQTCPTCRSNIPTGPLRPTAVPEGPAPRAARPEAGNNAAAQAPAAVPAPANAQPRPAPAPHFRFGVAFGRVAPPANAAVPGTPTPAGAAQTATPPTSGGSPVAAPGHPFAPGYPNPYMSPMMFGGVPFGFGMPGAYGMMPPFGMPPMGHIPGQQQGVQQQTMDPDSIQRQIDLLHAQLAVLQASAAQFSAPHQTQTVPQPPASAPTMPAAQQEVNMPVHAPAAPVSAPAAPVTVPVSPRSESGTEDLEDKRPIPMQQEAESTPAAASSSVPVESTIPPAPQTEAERRREELRQRYTRIYGSSSSDNEEKKGD